MNTTFPAQPFPVNAIPNGLRDVYFELQKRVLAPPEMVISSLLAATSIACQSRFSVLLPQGTKVPLSLFIIIVASSGERKTTLDNLALQPIRDFEKSFNDSNKTLKNQYETDLEIWKLKQKVLTSKMKKTFSKGKPTDTDEDAVNAHTKLKPVLAKTPKLIYTDATPEAIAWGMHTHWPSAALVSDEASMVLNGYAGSDLALLNKLRDGDCITIDRRTQESFTIRDTSFSLSLMIQPGSLQQFMNSQGKNARDIGFLSRCLITWPESTQGTRFVTGIQEVNLKNLATFHDRIICILEEGYKNAAAEKATLELSMEATDRYLDFYNNIEADMGNGRYLCDVRDAASKIAETTARMAALFHLYDGCAGKIQVEHFIKARDISYWYLLEFKRIFGAKPEASIEQIEAQLLECWLGVRFNPAIFQQSIAKNQIRKYGPNSLRSRDRLDRALDWLFYMGRITISLVGKTIHVFPNYDYFILRQFQNFTANQNSQPSLTYRGGLQ